MNGKLRKAIRIISAIVLAACIVILAVHFINSSREKAGIGRVDELKGTSAESAPPEMLSDYAALYAENPDTAGWLKIDGTEIDYVVMYAPDENEKYLHTDFFGEYSSRGCLYIDEYCDPDKSDNIIIYGHHMRDGSMFAGLMDYKSESFYTEHKYISFDTLYCKHSYEIVAVIETAIPPEDSDCFRYYEYVGENDDGMFTQYCSFIEENRLYDTGATLQPGDKILTLSTCAYHTENGRLVVVARQIS